MVSTTLHTLSQVVWQQPPQLQRRLLWVMALLVSILSLNLALPWLLKYLIDHLAQPHAQVTGLLWGYGGLWCVAQVLKALRRTWVYPVFEGARAALSSRVLDQVLRLHPQQVAQHSTGHTMNAIEQANQALPQVLDGLLFVMLPAALELLLAAGILSVAYDIYAAGMLLLLPVGYGALLIWSLSFLKPLHVQVRARRQQTAAYFTDVLLNLETIYHHQAQTTLQCQGDTHLQQRRQAVTHLLTRMSWVNAAQQGIAGSAFIALTTLVGWRVQQGEGTLGDFILCHGYLLQCLTPLDLLGGVIRDTQEGLERLVSATAILQTPVATPGTRTLSPEPAPWVWHEVSFRYPAQHRDALHDINFTLEPRTTLAVVGSNGSGKSTLIQLMTRLHTPTCGNITVQGQPLAQLSPTILQQHVAVVPQDIWLLNDTVRANLLLGNPHEDALTWLDDLPFMTWVRQLPQGLDTPVGERGVRLSGGEKRRLGVARAWLRQPKVWLLDEATSALDPGAERVLLQFLQTTKTTLLAVTHDEAVAQQAHQVLWLDRGQLRAQGAHSSLLNQHPDYGAFWRGDI